jgi:hypothetical protein
MRVLVVVLLGVVGAARPAGACPRELACIASGDVVAAPTRSAIAQVDSREALAGSLRAVVPKPGDVAMPWIWQVLSREVYRRMPRHEERRFTIVLSPVIVAGSFDTVPGVGLGGDF